MARFRVVFARRVCDSPVCLGLASVSVIRTQKCPVRACVKDIKTLTVRFILGVVLLNDLPEEACSEISRQGLWEGTDVYRC